MIQNVTFNYHLWVGIDRQKIFCEI
jgi:hypothetical protein